MTWLESVGAEERRKKGVCFRSVPSRRYHGHGGSGSATDVGSDDGRGGRGGTYVGSGVGVT